jgi:hypothetical protein
VIQTTVMSQGSAPYTTFEYYLYYGPEHRSNFF